MGFTLKHREHDSRGAFVAWGIGFRYEYDPAAKALSILDVRRKRSLLNIDFDEGLSESPLFYTEILEKTAQTDALMFSNNTTVDLSGIFDDGKLVPILEGCARTARYGFDLRRGDYGRFTRFFCEELSLKSLKIRTAARRESNRPYYFANMQTVHNNTISSHAPNLHLVMIDLARKTARDLITAEFGYHLQRSAHDLLMVSTRLSLLGRILDDRYVPEQTLFPADPILATVES